jgi:hypothetical protein
MVAWIDKAGDPAQLASLVVSALSTFEGSVDSVRGERTSSV